MDKKAGVIGQLSMTGEVALSATALRVFGHL
jgi:hypothetical protein